MKIIITTSRFPYPLEKGDKLRLYYQLVELSKNFEVHLFCLNEDVPDKKAMQALEAYCKSITVIKRSKLNIFFNLAKAIFSKLPFQVAYFKSNKAIKAFDLLVGEVNPKAIYAHLIRTAWLSMDNKEFKVIDLMDAFSHGMLERSKKTSFFKSIFYKIESKRVAAYEKKCYHTFDYSTVISDQDRMRLNLGANNRVINNGVSTDYFKRIDTIEKYDLVFVGNLGYKPNVDAVRFIVKKILPLLKGTMAPRILIAGARPSKEVLNYKNDKIEILPWVDDIRSAYSAGTVFIAPIFGGMGQQNKILEAMSIGIPCIVSNEVARGLNINDNQEVLIANTPEEFAFEIKKLLSDTNLQKTLITQAKSLVKEQYEWSKKTAKLVEIFKESKV